MGKDGHLMLILFSIQCGKNEINPPGPGRPRVCVNGTQMGAYITSQPQPKHQKYLAPDITSARFLILPTVKVPYLSNEYIFFLSSTY